MLNQYLLLSNDILKKIYSYLDKNEFLKKVNKNKGSLDMIYLCSNPTFGVKINIADYCDLSEYYLYCLHNMDEKYPISSFGYDDKDNFSKISNIDKWYKYSCTTDQNIEYVISKCSDDEMLHIYNIVVKIEKCENESLNKHIKKMVFLNVLKYLDFSEES